MFLEVLNTRFRQTFDKLSPLELKFGTSQVINVTNFVVVLSVDIKRVHCIYII